MAKATVILPFALERLLAELGLRIKLARQRRRISAMLFAERIGISRDTLNRLEKGDSTIAMGSYMKALYILNLEEDISHVAQDDTLGRKLQDAKLPGARPTRLQASPPQDDDTHRKSNRAILQELLKRQDKR